MSRLVAPVRDRQPWLLVWRRAAPKRCVAWLPRWGRDRWRFEQDVVVAASADDALSLARPPIGASLILVISREQMAYALDRLAPLPRYSRTNDYNPGMGWLPMVAPEFIVISSLGGQTAAHPVRAIDSDMALATWGQAYHRGRVIGGGSRADWIAARQLLDGERIEADPGQSWAGPGHDLIV